MPAAIPPKRPRRGKSYGIPSSGAAHVVARANSLPPPLPKRIEQPVSPKPVLAAKPLTPQQQAAEKVKADAQAFADAKKAEALAKVQARQAAESKLVAPVQRATPVAPSEPAVSPRVAQLLGPDGNALRDWRSYPEEVGGPNWYNKTEAQWLNNNNYLMGRLRPMIERGDYKAVASELEMNGYRSDELASQIKDFFPGNPGAAYDYYYDVNPRKQPSNVLRQVKYNVPHATADEQVARGALEAAGLTNVREGNYDPTMGTDIKANRGNESLIIDAQSRLSRRGELNLGIYASNRLIKAVNANPDSRLIDLIDQIRTDRYSPGYEDKLMQTMDRRFNRNPGDRLADNPDAFEKDAIISSRRKNPHRRSGLDMPLNPYDAALPDSIDYFDLNQVRDDVLFRTPRQTFQDMIGEIKGQRGVLKVALTPQYLSKLDSPVSMDEVNRFLSSL